MPSILYITQVHIESGAIKRLAEECQRHGIHKPLDRKSTRLNSSH